MDNPITVGTDKAKEESEEGMYVTFDGDGNYTIDLDMLWTEAVFFPFEVQFTYDGETTREWFMTPDDTVEIGGHTFSMKVSPGDGDTIRQLGAWVGDQYVPAYPEGKKFTELSGIVPFSRSLHQLKRVNAKLDLSKATIPAETRVKLDIVLDNMEVNNTDDPVSSDSAKGKKAVWARTNWQVTDDFKVIADAENGVVEFPFGRENIELIVGDADQLDPSETNIRYIVEVTGSSITEWDETGADKNEVGNYIAPWLKWTLKDNTGNEIEVWDHECYVGSSIAEFSFDLEESTVAENKDILLQMEFANTDDATKSFPEVKIYKADDEASAMNAVKAGDITDTTPGIAPIDGMWGSSAAGYTYDKGTIFLMKMMRGSICTGIFPFRVWIDRIDEDFSISSFRMSEKGSDNYWESSTYDYSNKFETFEVKLPGLGASSEYNIAIDHYFYKGKSYANVDSPPDFVKAIYEGHYDSREAAESEGAADVKEALFAGTYTGVFDEPVPEPIPFTIFCGDDSGEKFYVQALKVEGLSALTVSVPYLYEQYDGNWEHGYPFYKGSNQGQETLVYEVYDVTDAYPLRCNVSYQRESVTGNEAGKHAVAYEGDYVSSKDAIAAGAKQIPAEQIFAERPEDGYKVRLDSGKSISILVKEDDGSERACRYLIKVGYTDYIQLDALSEGYDGCEVYKVGVNDDSYSMFGYQTLLIMKENNGEYSAVDTDTMKNLPFQFSANPNATVYAGHNGDSGNGTPVKSGDPVDFSGSGPVQYSVVTQDNEQLKNFWVTVRTQDTTGGKLFVNGPHADNTQEAQNDNTNTRVIFLTDRFDNYHDIFLVNIGDADLENVNVTLESEYLEIDDYWNIRPNSTLKKMDSLKSNDYNELNNIAKLRLIAKKDATGSPVNGNLGKLTITAKNGDTAAIYLKGILGNPEITTTTIDPAIKYVHYSNLLMTNNIFDGINVNCTTTGKLPKGVTVKENGEIYGVPTETGEFTFTVTASFTVNTERYPCLEGITFPSCTREYTLKVGDNDDTAVWNASSEGHKVKTPIGTLERRLILYLCKWNKCPISNKVFPDPLNGRLRPPTP